MSLRPSGDGPAAPALLACCRPRTAERRPRRGARPQGRAPLALSAAVRDCRRQETWGAGQGGDRGCDTLAFARPSVGGTCRGNALGASLRLSRPGVSFTAHTLTSGTPVSAGPSHKCTTPASVPEHGWVCGNPPHPWGRRVKALVRVKDSPRNGNGPEGLGFWRRGPFSALSHSHLISFPNSAVREEVKMLRKCKDGETEPN